MILVADSGSTKCDWLLQTRGGDPASFQTVGFNPMFHHSEFIANEIQKNDGLTAIRDSVSSVFYYGASVSSEDRREIVLKALRACFPNATLQAEHDLTGAVRATCGDSEGVACILGTGSNSCYFDGRTIHDNIPALGYILGDEAGGAWFGRELLRHYLYGLLPAEVHGAIELLGARKEEIYRRVYRSEGVNVYLASFMPVLAEFRRESAIQNILRDGFDAFLKYHVIPFVNMHKVPVHFVGSVAVNFKDELQATCDRYQIKTGIFTHKPVEPLFEYHLRHAKL